MLIKGFLGQNDNRFFITINVNSPSLPRPVDIKFLIDTGATKTQISWNDAVRAGIKIRNLPQEVTPFVNLRQIYSGIGGKVYGYSLPDSTLLFNTNQGKKSMNIKSLSVMDLLTIEGNLIPPSASMLGIDILKKFDILFEERIVFLRI